MKRTVSSGLFIFLLGFFVFFVFHATNVLANNLVLSKTVFNTDKVSAGLGGIRNNGTGTLVVGGIGAGTINEAILYWQGPTNSTNPTANATVNFDGNVVTGTNIGFSNDNCWGFSNSQGYIADVTGIVQAKGDGNYAISNFIKTNSVNVNGLSLIVFFDDGDSANNRDYVIFHGNDSNISNTFDANGWNITLPGINYSSGTASMEMHISDGQPFEDAALILNSAVLAPSGNIFSGLTVPSAGHFQSLWDIKNFDITSFLSVGLNTLSLTTGVRSDCLGAVVIAIDLPAGAAPSTNTAPKADAGGDDMVDENAVFMLDGTGSSDAEGASLTYLWTQTAGPTVTLDDNTSVRPSFTAPYVTTNQTVTFELVVNDGELDSDVDSVDVVIKQVNQEPIADAGPDMNIKEGATKFLDGTDSFDPDGVPDPLTSFQWAQVGGPAVVLTDANTAAPSFVAPLGIGTTLVFHLLVNDGQEYSALSSLPDTNVDGDDLVTITVVGNSPPDADAGLDSMKNEGSVVQLDGSGSSDPDGDTLTFQWVQTGGSVVTLSDFSIVNPTFTAPAVMPGGEDFTFKLTVTDDDPTNRKSDMDEVVITVKNINDPPDCSLAVASSSNLWPPNHKMKQITIDGVTDLADAYPTFTIAVTGVTQDEPLDGTGDGDTSPDAVVQAGAAAGGTADAVLIRSERAGGSPHDGRVYVISFVADDGFESCTGSVAVGVPHDKKDTPVDSGQTVNSEGP